MTEEKQEVVQEKPLSIHDQVNQGLKDGKLQLTIPINDLRNKKLFIATPMYGGQCSGMYTKALSELTKMCGEHHIPFQIFFLFNESLITRARNYCADEFMRSDCTHLMFIDSDIGFNAADVFTLMALQDDSSPYDIIGAAYPKKNISWEKIKLAVDKGRADGDPNELSKFVGDYVFNPKINKDGTAEIPLTKPVEVSELGTGFMMIRRKTFEDYKKAYPFLMYRPDHVRTSVFDGSREIMAYFDCIIDRGYTVKDVNNILDEIASDKLTLEVAKDKIKKFKEIEPRASKRYLSEDYMFCYNVQKYGGQVWMCPWMQLRHVGSYVFDGSLMDIASIGAAATADPTQLKKKK